MKKFLLLVTVFLSFGFMTFSEESATDVALKLMRDVNGRADVQNLSYVTKTLKNEAKLFDEYFSIWLCLEYDNQPGCNYNSVEQLKSKYATLYYTFQGKEGILHGQDLS